MDAIARLGQPKSNTEYRRIGTACGLVRFVAIYISEVFVAGFVDEMRSMITGCFVIPLAGGWK